MNKKSANPVEAELWSKSKSGRHILAVTGAAYVFFLSHLKTMQAQRSPEVMPVLLTGVLRTLFAALWRRYLHINSGFRFVKDHLMMKVEEL